jgi:hypothetical protein
MRWMLPEDPGEYLYCTGPSTIAVDHARRLQDAHAIFGASRSAGCNRPPRASVTGIRSSSSNLPSLLISNGASSSARRQHVELHDPAATAAGARIGLRDDGREDHVTVAHDRVRHLLLVLVAGDGETRSMYQPDAPTALLLVMRAVIGGGSPKQAAARRPDRADRTRSHCRSSAA